MVVLQSPRRAQGPSLGQAGELIAVEQLVAKPAVERLGVAVLPRAARRDVEGPTFAWSNWSASTCELISLKESSDPAQASREATGTRDVSSTHAISETLRQKRIMSFSDAVDTGKVGDRERVSPQWGSERRFVGQGFCKVLA